jgi:restriction system protein
VLGHDRKGSVGAEVVRNFRGAMQGRADKGLIITTGAFTADARREATRDGAPAIDLINGEALCGLMKDLGLGVQVRQIRVEEISLGHVVNSRPEISRFGSID